MKIQVIQLFTLILFLFFFASCENSDLTTVRTSSESIERIKKRAKTEYQVKRDEKVFIESSFFA